MVASRKKIWLEVTHISLCSDIKHSSAAIRGKMRGKTCSFQTVMFFRNFPNLNTIWEVNTNCFSYLRCSLVSKLSKIIPVTMVSSLHHSSIFVSSLSKGEISAKKQGLKLFGTLSNQPSFWYF